MFEYTTKKIILVLFVILMGPQSVCAASPKKGVDEGNRLYAQEDYAAAKEKYAEALEKDAESDIINFNLGAALYKNEEYDQAIAHFQKSLLSEDETLKLNSSYNLGNTLYKSGVIKEEEDIQTAIKQLEAALTQYEGALELGKDNDEVEQNYEFVKGELERLKLKAKQQEQQKQKPSSDQQQDQKGEDQHKSEGQQQQGQEGKQDEQQGKQGEEGQQGQESQEEGKEDQAQAGKEEASEEDEKEQKKASAQKGQEGEKDSDGSDAKAMDAQAITQKEARMLLENYEQTEQPQGLLNVFQERGKWRPVEKDW